MNDNVDLATILVVDDAPENIKVLSGILSDDYKVKVALSGEKALNIANGKDHPDLVLLDVMMPEMDGFEVCRRLKNNPVTKDIPVIFVTAKGEVVDEQTGFEVGCVDYITKPVSPPIVEARVKSQIELHNQKKLLESLVQQRTEELNVTQDVTILSMSTLAETRDNETGGHILRTREYVRALGSYLTTLPEFKNILDLRMVEEIAKSAPLHDIGKVGIPDSILLKPGKLTDEEFETMRTHAEIGWKAIKTAEEALGQTQSSSFLHYAREITYTHHEKWNGHGYPRGLEGEEIPLSGRMMAIADVYDALISKRYYKPPMTHEKAKSIILEERGKSFDPVLVNAFVAIEDEFQRIAEQYADHEE